MFSHRHYKAGELISIRVEITVDRKGYFEFHLCPRDNVQQTVTHECFKR